MSENSSSTKLSDLFLEGLRRLGYTHCYFVAGGNIMHLLDSVRARMSCVPFIHEVGAAIATEYHNASIPEHGGRAFCLVTAGPGLTNCLTAVAGAWQESRELLLIGGQVKQSDLSSRSLRQRGIQEVDGIALTRSITKASIRMRSQGDLPQAFEAIVDGRTPRKGPVFIEWPLDVQAEQCSSGIESMLGQTGQASALKGPSTSELAEVSSRLEQSARPVLLIGGGVSRSTAERCSDVLKGCGIPIMTTYNGADRVPSDWLNYFGRPNTWGMRYANVLIQQSDLLICLGTRLGLQQTGFNWQEFAPLADIIQIDLDREELTKGHPRVAMPICADADQTLEHLSFALSASRSEMQKNWLEFCLGVKAKLPLSENSNSCHKDRVNPYDFYFELSRAMPANCILVPSSSGSSFTCAYQSVLLKRGQKMLSNKSQASMGYGLAGAIGAALGNPRSDVFLVEGDGGFLQNAQELAVARRNNLRIKIFLWVNGGYASIRMTQRRYFKGAWIGCDEESGLGFPDWVCLFKSFGIPSMEMRTASFTQSGVSEFIASEPLCAVLVQLHPDQTFYPKIDSRITASGSMESNPLHLIGPALEPQVFQEVCPYIIAPNS